MEYASQLANIANVQNYAAQFKDTRLSSLKHPGEFFDYQRVSSGSFMSTTPYQVDGSWVRTGMQFRMGTDRGLGL